MEKKHLTSETVKNIYGALRSSRPTDREIWEQSYFALGESVSSEHGEVICEMMEFRDSAREMRIAAIVEATQGYDRTKWEKALDVWTEETKKHLKTFSMSDLALIALHPYPVGAWTNDNGGWTFKIGDFHDPDPAVPWNQPLLAGCRVWRWEIIGILRSLARDAWLTHPDRIERIKAA